MTHMAAITVEEAQAAALSEEIAAHPPFDGLTVDASEVSPGKWEVAVYFPDAPTEAQRKALSQFGRFKITELPDTDWVAKSLEGLKPVRAGRFLVHGRHDRGQRKPNDIAIEIEAGQAFGTGHHGTTAGCLVAIEAVAKSRRIRNALDVGTGSGVLAIAITRLAKAPVLASDIDPVATRIAKENAQANGVGRWVQTLTATGLEGATFRKRGPYDLIVANILAGPLAALAPAISRHLAPGGVVILSGLLPEQWARIVAAYRGTGLALWRALVRDGWLTLSLTRPPKRKGRRPKRRPSR